jgi:alpha-D-ribose 1-methylphosphonate 5-triphosphate synthase subunit PhnG
LSAAKSGNGGEDCKAARVSLRSTRATGIDDVADSVSSAVFDDAVAARKAMMATLADANLYELQDGIAAIGAVEMTELRPAETGLVMLRGRVSGDGAAFNLGEAPVTRAAVRIATGETGFSYILGRDKEKARAAALCDALWQSPRHRDAVDRHILAPVRERCAAARLRAREETAATRVDFFTLVRGD